MSDTIDTSHPDYTPTKEQLVETAIIGSILSDDREKEHRAALLRAIGKTRLQEEEPTVRQQALRTIRNIEQEAYNKGYQDALNKTATQ